MNQAIITSNVHAAQAMIVPARKTKHKHSYRVEVWGYAEPPYYYIKIVDVDTGNIEATKETNDRDDIYHLIRFHTNAGTHYEWTPLKA